MLSFSLASSWREWYNPGGTLWNGNFDIVALSSLTKTFFVQFTFEGGKALFQLVAILCSFGLESHLSPENSIRLVL